MSTATQLSPFKAALAIAKAQAMATGRMTTVVADRSGACVVAKATPVKPAYVSRELQGNTAADRAERNWTEDDYVALSHQIEGDADAQLDRDASWFAGWYTERRVSHAASVTVAKRIAMRHTRDESPARIRKVRKTTTVGFAPCATWPNGRSWAIASTVYEITYTVRVCYVVEGDPDFVAPETEPVEFDLAGPNWVEPSGFDPNFESYPEWETTLTGPTNAAYLAAAVARERARI